MTTKDKNKKQIFYSLFAHQGGQKIWLDQEEGFIFQTCASLIKPIAIMSWLFGSMLRESNSIQSTHYLFNL